MSGMEPRIKYIDCGLVTRELYTGLWEVQHLVDIKPPYMVSFAAVEPIVPFSSVYEIDLSHIMSNMPEALRLFEQPLNVEKDFRTKPPPKSEWSPVGFYLECPTVQNLHFVHDFDMDTLNTAIKKSLLKICNYYGIDVKFNRRNDALMKKDGRWKKFVGCGWSDVFEFNTADISISFQVDSTLGEEVIKLDSEKRAVKAKRLYDSFNNIQIPLKNIIGGLHEINPKVKQEKFMIELVSMIAENLGCELEHSNLSDKNHKNINDRGILRLNDSEWQLFGRTKIKN